MKRFTAWREDFAYHLAEWCYEDQWETGRKPGKLRRIRLAVELVWFRATHSRFVCAIFDHQYVDDDPGNAEVGPQPHVYCTRCGAQ